MKRIRLRTFIIACVVTKNGLKLKDLDITLMDNIANAIIFLAFVIIFKSFGTKVESTPWNIDYQRRLVEALERLAKNGL